MKNRARVLASAGLVTLAMGLTFATPVPTATASPFAAAADDATEDILYMEDGRVLRGEIVSEDLDTVVFRLVSGGISSKLRLNKIDITKIERDVAVETDDADEQDAPPMRETPDASAPTMSERSFGTLEVPPGTEGVPELYFLPMKGQLGTDITPSIYKEIVEDIRRVDPDYIVIEMSCTDRLSRQDGVDPSELGFLDIGVLDDYREIGDVFGIELRDIPQVVWIKDALGPGCVMAMIFPDIYMASGARLGGIERTGVAFAQADKEITAKFREAFMAILSGFALYGRYDSDLLQAMVRPEQFLSGTWRGREVEWRLDKEGQYLFDGSDEQSVTFTAKTAEDFCISKGTAETVDDLALLMGIREYSIADGKGTEIFDDYVEDWRKAYENCEDWLQDAQTYGAGGTRADLNNARRALERVLAQINRWHAVELRLQREYGVSAIALQDQIGRIKERIKALSRNADRRAPAGRGGGGFGSGG